MGTPDFAVRPLEMLLESGIEVVGVVTNPDKPAGRGQRVMESAVKKFAVEKKLTLLQPEKFRDPDFLSALKSLKADLQVVVAFKMLPEVVWNMPPQGTINLHASLLPDYRGAAPINHAIMNGETETGITTFLLKGEIDTGDILFQETVPITQVETAGALHDKLMEKGAFLVVKTVKAIAEGCYVAIPQREVAVEKKAPKIFKNDCQIDWNQQVDKVYNHIRGLSPYPAAWTTLCQKGKELNFKLYEVKLLAGKPSLPAGGVETDGKTYLNIATASGWVQVQKLQMAGKKALPISDFLRGFHFEDESCFR